jgi:hypothetical protein
MPIYQRGSASLSNCSSSEQQAKSNPHEGLNHNSILGKHKDGFLRSTETYFVDVSVTGAVHSVTLYLTRRVGFGLFLTGHHSGAFIDSEDPTRTMIILATAAWYTQDSHDNRCG